MSDKYHQLKSEYDQFTYIVSHDLGAPIRQVKAFLTIFLDEMSGQTEDQKTYADLMFKSLEHADEILAGLLQLSRLNTYELSLEKIELKPFLVKIADRFDFVSLDDIAPDYIFADPTLLERVIVELLSNSNKYNNQTNPIKVSISARNCETSNSVILSVSDNGIGIDEKFRETVFEPLRTLHAENNFDGCGMGLTVCRKIMNLHDGTIRLEDSKLGGICMDVMFPNEK